jgi:large subunit ribosomal protein L18
MKNKKEVLRKKRHKRIKLRMNGCQEKPRLVIRRSLNNFSAQVVDDTKRKVLFSASTASKEFKQKCKESGNVKAVLQFAVYFSQKAKENGIKKIIFDRAGYLYHGRVKAFADGIRKEGIEF